MKVVETEKIGECAYCGAVGKVTRDHIPSKAIFSKPLPDDLITVPACPKCHSDETSKDDEYFRLALQVRDGIADHPDAIKARPTLLRSLEKPQKVGMMKGLLENIFFADVVTLNGIFIGKQWAIQTDMNRLRRVVKRIMRGLFYKLKHHRVPDDYDVLVCDEDSFQKWPPHQAQHLYENFIKPVLAQKERVMIGNDVFSFKYGYGSNNPDTTCWILTFYQRASFLGLTLPPLPK
jgi:hypothetical protein